MFLLMKQYFIISAVFLMLFLPFQGIGQLTFSNATDACGIETCPSNLDGVGVAAADFDEDGDIDFFVPSDVTLKNHLYVNQGDGTFEEESQLRGITDNIAAKVPLWFDYNGDHLLDLLLVGDCVQEDEGCLDELFIRLYQQLPDHTFTDKTVGSGLLTGFTVDPITITGGVAAGDLNGDGYLDIIMNFWVGQSFLYLNNQDGTFSEIGFDVLSGNKNFYLQPVMFDVNGDHLLDIFIAMDGEENELWINRGNLYFEESAKLLGVNSEMSDMGVALGDIENDGDIDLYTTHVTGNRSHNRLFRNESNTGELVFTEVATEYGVAEGGWGWGATFFDANNDGLLDLAESNGWLNVKDYRMPSKFWMNNGSVFEDKSEQIGFTEILDTNGLISADYDRDGDQDLFETTRISGDHAAMRVLKNNFKEDGGTGNYLVIQPRMLGPNHWAYGARVVITVQDTQMTRLITAGSSYYSQEPAEAFFGLGSNELVDEVRITWPGGSVTTLSDVPANQVLTVTDEEVLHTPTDLSVTYSDFTEIELSWSHLSSSESGYVIERAANETFVGATEIPIESGARKYLDTGLNTGEFYFYRLKAIGSNLESPYSNEITTTPQEFIATPKDPFVSNLTHNELTIEWVDISDNEAEFVIERSKHELFPEPTVFSIDQNLTSFTDNTVVPYTTYYYRVRGEKPNSKSANSRKVEITTPDYIEPPSDLVTFRESNTVMRLEWTDNSNNEDGFIIERSLTEDFLYIKKTRVGNGLTQFKDREVFGNVKFYYRIKAFNKQVESAYSNSRTGIVTSGKVVDQEVIVYPNPARDVLWVKLPGAMPQAQLTLLNTAGSEVYSTNLTGENNRLTLNLPPGLYVMVLRDEQGTFVRKKIHIN